jgi:ATP-dependent helicase/nuclease subunit A
LRAREAAARPGVVPRADEVEPHGLFVVGDRKQSIYGFRGADVSIFCRVCADLAGSAAREALGLPEAPDAPSPSADFVALRESRRSGPRVLAFVNAFAARDFGMDRAPGDAPREYDVAYGAAERLCPVEREGGPRDEVILVDDRAAPDASRDPTALGGARPPAPGPAREALAAAAFVAREVRAGGHGTAWRDVAVLARRRSTIPFVELALARLRVPYVVAGRALYDAPEIRDVAALLRLLLDPRDRRALATVLRGPMVSLSEAGLAALAVPGRGLSVPLLGRRPRPEAPGAAALELLSDADRARLEAARARFPDVRAAALRMTPGEAIRHAVRAFELDRVLAALPRADARLGNVDRLVGIARRRGGTLASFARWLERRIDQDADEAEAAVFSPEDDAVRITTVHASKGLDFPVVVLVDLNAEPRGEVAPVGFAPATRAAPATLVVKHVGRPPHAGTLAGAPPGEPDPFDGRELVVLPTAAVRDEQLEARSREAAERRRLTYVAMTRARSVLALVAPAAPPRARSAWRTLAGEPTADDDDLEAAVAPRLDPELAPHVTRVVDAAALAVEAASALDDAAPPPPGEVRAPPTPARPSSPARVVALATTPLALFHGCPRRFRLRALLGLEEPVSSGQLDLFGEPDDDAGAEDARALEGAGEADPRALGRAAHRVLERWPAEAWGAPTSEADVAQRLALEGLPATSAETQRMAEGLARFLGGPYARGLRAAGATLGREEPFVLPLAPAAPAAAALALRGAMDLVVTHPDGSIDVVDYKRSRPRADLGPYAFQLRAYALEARRRSPGRPIRAGIVFLGAAETPAWLPGAGPGGALSEAEHERFAEELADLARRFAEARWSDRFDGVAFDACRRLRCGFVAACHR